VLGQFEDFIKEVDAREGKDAFDGRAKMRRRERANRDAFKRLLRDLVKDGKIYCLTKWMDVYPLVKREDCFVDMLGQEGSSPLDLFFDVVVDGDETYRRDKTAIKSAIKDAKPFVFGKGTTRKEFMAVLGDKLRRYEKHSADLVFDELMLDAEYFHEQELRRREKKDRREREDMEDDFKYLLKHLDPPLEADEKWKDVSLRVKDSKEYKGLSEEVRKDIWERLRSRLESKSGAKGDLKKESKRARDGDGRKRASMYVDS
jgi:pre-mRNA-processing factor 40